MRLVVDSSVVVAGLTDDGPLGRGARQAMRDATMYAPDPIDIEVIAAVRGLMMRGDIEEIVAADAVDDVSRLRIKRLPTAQLHQRIWSLRHNVVPYDACYVALAEALGLPLFTLDRRLAASTGPTCEFLSLE